MKLSFRLRYLISGEVKYIAGAIWQSWCADYYHYRCVWSVGHCPVWPQPAATLDNCNQTVSHIIASVSTNQRSAGRSRDQISSNQSLSTLLTVSGHFNISTTSHQQRKWDRIYRLVWNHVYYSLWSLSCMNMNTDWILFMRMSWHWGLVSDGYFAVLLNNWIIVVSELSWFLIILW